jgi:hypothetical protein
MRGMRLASSFFNLETVIAEGVLFLQEEEFVEKWFLRSRFYEKDLCGYARAAGVLLYRVQ